MFLGMAEPNILPILTVENEKNEDKKAKRFAAKKEKRLSKQEMQFPRKAF